jgi:hypothetical protein
MGADQNGCRLVSILLMILESAFFFFLAGVGKWILGLMD